MADQEVVVAKRAKAEEVSNEDAPVAYADADAYFAKFRPDRESRCTWTKDSCPKDSPHLHDDNV